MRSLVKEYAAHGKGVLKYLARLNLNHFYPRKMSENPKPVVMSIGEFMAKYTPDRPDMKMGVDMASSEGSISVFSAHCPKCRQVVATSTNSDLCLDEANLHHRYCEGEEIL